jgi:lipopolysaccharide transport system ATP-binding protein
MTDIAIRAEGLGKTYRIGTRQRYHTFRDTLTRWARAPVRWLRRNRPDDDTGRSQPFWALKDVSFEVPRGEVVGVIGRNGAGKSTLLKILSRITEPTEGQVELDGRLGSLLEVGTGFHPELTGRENIFLNGAILGMKRAEILRKFDEIVAFAEVEKFIDTPVKFYSSGMYMRLAFSVAAHLDTEILLVDEVLAVGDAPFQEKCLGKMRTVAKTGRTVLFVSHNMQAIALLTTESLLLGEGRLVFRGPTERAIATYFQLCDAGNSQRDGMLRRAGSGEYRFTAVAPGKSVFGCAEPKQVRFTVQRQGNRVGRMYLAAHVVDPHGLVVCQCDSRLAGGYAADEDSFSGELRFGSPWLKPGEYRVDMFLCLPGVGIIDSYESACLLRVSPVLPYQTLASEEATANGLVLADFAWTFSLPGQTQTS